jgi:uncharacterized protein (DUF1810 family)
MRTVSSASGVSSGNSYRAGAATSQRGMIANSTRRFTITQSTLGFERAMDDRFQLRRFVDAQQPVYERVLEELRAGRKRTHWMWFIFPQIAGLGHSSMAREFALSSLDEAIAYLAHPVLGRRLRECTALVADIEGRPIAEIFGYPDDMKFCSSMTLFSQAAPEEPIFAACLNKYFGAEPDPQTLARLRTDSRSIE